MQGFESYLRHINKDFHADLEVLGDLLQVVSSARARCGSPAGRANHPQQGRADPQTERRPADTASSGSNTAAPQTPSLRRTSFQMQLKQKSVTMCHDVRSLDALKEKVFFY